MNKRMKAALGGLAFVAGCEIGIAIQLMKMVHKYVVKENAVNTPLPDPDDVALEPAAEKAAVAAPAEVTEPAAEAPAQVTEDAAVAPAQ